MKTMNITIKQLKHLIGLSRETNCFTAIVYLDGVKAIAAANEGCGGSTAMIDIVPGSVEKLARYSDTLPKVVTDLEDPTDRTKKFSYRPTAESLIDIAVERELILRQMRRSLKRTTYFRVTGKKSIGYFTRVQWIPANIKHIRAYLDKTFGAGKYIILNEQTEDKALKLWEQQF